MYLRFSKSFIILDLYNHICMHIMLCINLYFNKICWGWKFFWKGGKFGCLSFDIWRRFLDLEQLFKQHTLAYHIKLCDSFFTSLQTNFIFSLPNKCILVPNHLLGHISIGFKSKQNYLAKVKCKILNLNFRRRWTSWTLASIR